MEMDIEFLTEAPAIILRPKNRIDGTTATNFEEQYDQIEINNALVIIVDLSLINYISSAGLRAILICAKKAKSSGNALTLSGAKGSAKEVIKISGFDALLGLHDTVDEALAHLGR